LCIDEVYDEALELLSREIEAVRDIYNENRQTLVVPRGTTPIAGRILWVRQLYSRIENPMNVFKVSLVPAGLSLNDHTRCDQKVTEIYRPRCVCATTHLRAVFNFQ